MRQSVADTEQAPAAHDGRLLTLEEAEPRTMAGGTPDVSDGRLSELVEQITDLSSQLTELRSDFDEIKQTMQSRKPPSGLGSGNRP